VESALIIVALTPSISVLIWVIIEFAHLSIVSQASM